MALVDYCEQSEVESEFRGIVFSKTSVVTTTEIRTFIERYSAIIDGALSSKYVTPIVGENSLLIVKELCILLAAGRVARILKLEGGSDTKKQDTGRNFMKEAENLMKKILDDTIKLPDATEQNQGRIASYNDDNSIVACFDKDLTQW